MANEYQPVPYESAWNRAGKFALGVLMIAAAPGISHAIFGTGVDQWLLNAAIVVGGTREITGR